MTTRNMMMMAGAGLLTYYLFKKKSAGKNEGPGVLNRFVDKVKQSVGKELDEIGEDIPARASMHRPMNA